MNKSVGWGNKKFFTPPLRLNSLITNDLYAALLLLMTLPIVYHFS